MKNAIVKLGQMLRILNIDLIITPMNDHHLNELINDSDNRVKALTDFTGTSGTAFTGILKDGSGYFLGLETDGRYYSQASKQLTDYILLKEEEHSIFGIIKKTALKRIGIDPNFISYIKYEKLKRKLARIGVELVDTVDLVGIAFNTEPNLKFDNIIDLERYDYSSEPVFFKYIDQLDKLAKKKIKDADTFIDHRNNLVRVDGVESAHLIDIDSRIPQINGGYSHLTGSRTNKNHTNTIEPKNILKEDTLYQGGKSVIKLTDGPENITGSSRMDKIKTALSCIENNDILIITELATIAWLFNLRGIDIKHGMVFYSYAAISHEEILLFVGGYNVERLKIDGIQVIEYSLFEKYISTIRDRKVVISGQCNAYIGNMLSNKSFTEEIKLKQSVKTERELYGMLEANIVDSLALIRAYEIILESKEEISENKIEEIMDEFKKENRNHLTNSFRTTVGVDSNSGDLHHENSDQKMSNNSMVLIDTGSHYLFGTTDITRTISRAVTGDIKRIYTLVLKSVIAAKLVGKNPTGRDIDKAAREVLKKQNIFYASATGHGIGTGMNVHEKYPMVGFLESKIMKNNVFSIEPGYYDSNKFGIRIEDNVFLGKNGKVQDLTFIPYQMNLIDISELTKKEIDYLNKYNRKCRMLLMPLLKDGIGSKFVMDNTMEIKLIKK